MTRNKFISFSHVLLIGCYLSFSVAAQITTIPADKTDSTPEKLRSYYKNQLDLIDIALIIIHKDPGKRLDSNETKNLRLHLSASPILEYTLSTGLTTGVAGSGAFFTSVKKQTNTSLKPLFK